MIKTYTSHNTDSIPSNIVDYCCVRGVEKFKLNFHSSILSNMAYTVTKLYILRVYSNFLPSKNMVLSTYYRVYFDDMLLLFGFCFSGRE